MMYLIPEPVANKSSPSRPSAYRHPEKSSPSLLSHTQSRRRYCSSDEEDESRDRQSHWKRLKTRSDDHHRGSSRTLIRYTERDHERSPPHPVAPSRTNPRPGHRVIVLKGKEQDAGLRRCRSGSQAWNIPDDMLLRGGDGGAASPSQAIYPMRKNESMMDSTRRFSMTSERIMVEDMARRASAEKRYEIRVSGMGEGLSFEDSPRHADDAYIIIPARMGSNALKRWTGGGETMNRESRRDFGDRQSKAPWWARRVDFDSSGSNGKGRTDEGRGYGDGLGNRTAAVAAAAGVEAKERDMESEIRHEKRERWAEKERDLEKEQEKENSLPKTQGKAGVTVVDYSHKFTVAEAPISAAAKPVEVDPNRLCQRQKQIDYGKNTLGYERYTESVPRYQRTKAHPRTPDIRQVCSKRSWDGQIRKWRRLLHDYDPPKGEDEEDPDLMFGPTRDQERSATEDSPMDMQSEFVEDPDLKIYDGWSDDEC